MSRALMEPEKLARAWVRGEGAGGWEMLKPGVQAEYLRQAEKTITELGIPPQGLLDENYWLYRAIWEPTAGKPFTHVMRENPGAYGLLLVAGLTRLTVAGGRQWWVVLLAFAIGLLTGHVFW